MKKCTLCGDEFSPNSARQVKCKKIHMINCVECGKSIVHNKKKRFCSQICGSKNQAKNFLRDVNCKLCGNLFKGKINQKFCSNPHTFECVICNEIYLKEPTTRVKTCSKSCSIEMTKQTNLNKYGVENVFQDKNVIAKIKNTNIKKYGIDHPMKTETVQNKLKDKMRLKYGVDYPLQNKEILQRAINTNYIRYGVPNPAMSEEIIAKTKLTNIERYGFEYTFQSELVKDKIRKTMVDKYGSNLPQLSAESRLKATNTMKIRYNAENFSNSREYAFRKGVSNLDEWMEFEKFIKNNKLNIKEIAIHFNVSIESIFKKLKREKLLGYTNYSKNYSINEIYWSNYLDELGVNFIQNDRKVIAPKELDFLLPNESLAIEVSPTRTHFYSEFNQWGGKTDKNYHYKKYLECLRLDIDLITIFEWHSDEKIKEIIYSKLNNIKNITHGVDFIENNIITDNSLGSFRELEKTHRRTSHIAPRAHYYNKNTKIKASPLFDISNNVLTVYDCGYTKWTLK